MTSKREPKRECPGMTWTLRSLCRPFLTHLLTTRRRAVSKCALRGATRRAFLYQRQEKIVETLFLWWYTLTIHVNWTNQGLRRRFYA